MEVPTKDFPSSYITTFELDAAHPDNFITSLINADKEKALEALLSQVRNLKRPPKSAAEVLEALEKCGLKNSVSILKS